MTRKKKVLLGCVLPVGLVLLVGGIVYGPVVRDFWRAGVLPDLLSKTEMREYEAGREENLQEIHRAIMRHHDSEGAFPEAANWMDDVRRRIKTNDMTDEEALKKLQNPLCGGAADCYRYALNRAVSGMYIEDIPNADEVVLVYETSDPAWNAAGEETEGFQPNGTGDVLGITIGGVIVRR